MYLPVYRDLNKDATTHRTILRPLKMKENSPAAALCAISTPPDIFKEQLLWGYPLVTSYQR